MTSKKLLSTALVGSMILSLTACESEKTDETTSVAAATETAEETATLEETTAEKVTLHHGDDGDQSTVVEIIEETTGTEDTTGTEETAGTEETTKAEAPDETDGVTEKFSKLMKLSYDEARDYYNVTLDESLTGDDFDAYLNDMFVDAIAGDYLSIHEYLKNPENYGMDLSDVDYDLGTVIVTDEDRDIQVEEYTNYLTELLKYPYDNLSERQRLVYDKLYYEDTMSIWMGSVTDLSSAVSANVGLIPNIAITFYEYIFDSEDDVIAYSRILDYLPGTLDEIYEDIQQKIDKYGLYPSDYQLETNIEVAKELTELKNNPFIDAYNEKIDALGLDDAAAKKYKEENEKFYTEEIIPAFEKVVEELSELLGKNVDGKGLCEYENGKEYYEMIFENQVGDLITPEEALAILEDDVKNKMEIESITAVFCMSELGKYYNGELEFEAFKDKDAQEIMEFVKEELADDFPSIDDVTASVTELPKSLCRGGVLAYYLIPRVDAEELNIIRYNKYSLGEDIFETVGTIAHEGYPGHMLQFNLQKRNGGYPIESIISHLSYTEGWAQAVMTKSYYKMGCSESFAKVMEADSYVNYDVIGIADIGFNYLGWTNDQYYKEMSGYGIDFADSDIAQIRNMVTGDPALYLPYSLGPVIVSSILKDYAKEHSEYESYEAFCRIGAAPFGVVRKYMDCDFE